MLHAIIYGKNLEFFLYFHKKHEFFFPDHNNHYLCYYLYKNALRTFFFADPFCDSTHVKSIIKKCGENFRDNCFFFFRAYLFAFFREKLWVEKIMMFGGGEMRLGLQCKLGSFPGDD
jgi:hypothetical protein